MAEPMLIAKSDQDVYLLPKMANRHGVPVFMSDVKGDLFSISQPGKLNPKRKVMDRESA